MGTAQSLTSNWIYANPNSWIYVAGTVTNNVVFSNFGMAMEQNNGAVNGNTFYNYSLSGIRIDGSQITVSSNVMMGIGSNNSAGINVAGSNCVITGNTAYNNGGFGIEIGNDSNNLVSNNTLYSNNLNLPADGQFILSNATNNTIVNNTIYSNSLYSGLDLGAGSSNNLVVGNNIYGTPGNGISIYGGSNNNVFIANDVWGNAHVGVALYNGPNTGNVWVQGSIGYSSMSVLSADSLSPEISIESTSSNTLVLKGVLAHTPLVSSTSFATAGSYVLSYNENDNAVGAATGTAVVYGDYQVSGSTFTLDYSTNSYASAFTAAQLITGSGHSISTVTTVDGATLSELITVQNTSGNTWTVSGSSSGVLGTFTCAAGNSSGCAFTNGKVNLTLITGATMNVGDMLVFGTMASSNDANIQKQLRFGAGASTLNNGRSKIEIASSGGFQAVGQSSTTNPTLVGMLGSGGTYYTFVDSGSFVTRFSSFTNMDESGIQLNGSGPFWIADSTFDYSGNGVLSTSTLFSLNSVTNSSMVIRDVTYGNNRLNTKNYNYTISGSSTGLAWNNINYSGALTGHANELNDPANLITWGTVTVGLPGGNVRAGT